MKRIMLLASVMALAVGLLAPAAQADVASDTSVTVFVGTATVCANDNSPGTNGAAAGCPLTFDKAGTPIPSGSNGLYLIGHPGKAGPTDTSKWAQRTGVYHFESTTACVTLALRKTSGGNLKDCGISVDGQLSPVAGIGAACGVSHGHNGIGTLKFLGAPKAGMTYNLKNVGWVTSLGGTLPVTGTYKLATPAPAGKGKASGNDDRRSGPLVGVVQAQGGAPCVKNPVTGNAGASSFTVVGVVAAL